MNDFGLVQLIWIKRLVSETSRINTLIECNSLSPNDLNRYRAAISSIDDFCAFVINSQNWRDLRNIPEIVDEVEMVLFQHFYEQIDAFEDEKVHLDLSSDDEVNLRFENPFIDDQRFDVIDDDAHMNLNVFENSDGPFYGPILEADIIESFGDGGDDSFLELFGMEEGESREISLEDLIKILNQNQESLSFTLNPEAFPNEADILSEDEEVSLEEFIAHLTFHSPKGMRFGIIDDSDDFII